MNGATPTMSLCVSGVPETVTGRQRSPIASEVSTAMEQGFPDGEFDGLTGIFGPRGTPDDRRDRIAADIRAVAADPSFVERLTALGQTVRGSTPAEFTAAIDERYAKMVPIVASLARGPNPKDVWAPVGLCEFILVGGPARKLWTSHVQLDPWPGHRMPRRCALWHCRWRLSAVQPRLPRKSNRSCSSRATSCAAIRRMGTRARSACSQTSSSAGKM
jgi:Tripartite tricarboxylate transporter family receptor